MSTYLHARPRLERVIHCTPLLPACTQLLGLVVCAQAGVQGCRDGHAVNLCAEGRAALDLVQVCTQAA